MPRRGLGIAHCRSARLHNERPQLGEVLTRVVKIGEAIPPQDSFAGQISFAPDRAAQGRPQPGIILAIFLAANAPFLLLGNGSGQMSLGRIAFDRVMAADEFERADQTAFTAAIAQAALIQRSPSPKKFSSRSSTSAACAGSRMCMMTAPDRDQTPNLSLTADPPQISSQRQPSGEPIGRSARSTRP
jgi:hypothetical protein